MALTREEIFKLAELSGFEDDGDGEIGYNCEYILTDELLTFAKLIEQHVKREEERNTLLDK